MEKNAISPEQPVSRLTPTKAALAVAALIGLSAVQAQAEDNCACPGAVEVSQMTLKMKGHASCGVLKMNLDGCVGSSLNAELSLAGRIQQGHIDALNNKDVEGTFEGTIKDGKLVGRLHIISPIDINLPVELPLQECGRTAGSVKRLAATPRAAKKVVKEEPVRDANASVNLIKIPEPLTPGTFFVDKPDSKYTEGGMRAFDVTDSSEVTFFVTGPAKVWLNLYPIVFTNEGKRNAEKPMQARIVVDSETYEIPAQMPAKDGAPVPGTESTGGPDQGAVWNKPVRVGPFDIPAGSMSEVTVSTLGYGFKVTVEGAVETKQPKALAAKPVPFSEDHVYTPEFEFDCRLNQAVNGPAGLQLTQLTPSPLDLGEDGLTVDIERFRDSALATVGLHNTGKAGKRNHVEYKLARPLTQAYTDPNDPADSKCVFIRTVPPAESTDPAGPSEIQVTVNLENESEPRIVDQPGNMTCQFNGPNLTCWERNAQTAQVRAYRTTAAQRYKKLPKIPLVHRLRGY